MPQLRFRDCMKEPHHQRKVGYGMIMVAASLALIGILQLSIGPDVLFGDTIQRQQLVFLKIVRRMVFKNRNVQSG